MSKPKHTPGKWRAWRLAPEVKKPEYKIASVHHQPRGAEYIAKCSAAADLPAQANAERIVACVNACEGIADPSVVPELLAAIKRIEMGCSLPLNDVERAIIQVLRPLLARAEGKKDGAA